MPQYFGAYCPMGQSCSKKGRLLAKHLDEAAARAAVAHHINNSPYHADLDWEQKRALIEAAAIPFWDEEEEEAHQQEEHEGVAIGAKRYRKSSDAPRREGTASSSSAGLDADAIASAVAAGVQQVMVHQMQQQQQHMLQTQPPAQVALHAFSARPPPPSDDVLVPRPLIQLIIEHLSRAEAAAMQGARVASAASAAFEQERAVIADCAMALHRLLRQTQG